MKRGKQKNTIEFDKMGLWHEAYKDHKESKKKKKQSKIKRIGKNI